MLKKSGDRFAKNLLLRQGAKMAKEESNGARMNAYNDNTLIF